MLIGRNIGSPPVETSSIMNCAGTCLVRAGTCPARTANSANFSYTKPSLFSKRGIQIADTNLEATAGVDL